MEVYQPLGKYNPLFKLSAEHEGCTREAVEFTEHINLCIPKGKCYWVNTKEGFLRAYVDAMYYNNPPRTASRWWKLCQETLNPQLLMNPLNVTTVEIPSKIRVEDEHNYFLEKRS